MPPDPLKVPAEHRLEAELRVCDPDKTDHTHSIESWRVLRMMAELADGFAFLKNYRLAATFFGSSRLALSDPFCKAAEELAGKLARSGFAIITGGAGGIMEAANKGAFEANGESIGLNIALPAEQAANRYLTEQKTFNYFFTRKVMLSFASEVYVYFPGGYGTLNEFFEIITLVQTGKIKCIPIVLYGRHYWQPFIDLLEKHVYSEYQAVSKADLDLYRMVDTVEDAHQAILTLVNC